MEVPGAVRPGDAGRDPLDRRDLLVIAACLALALGARLFYWLRFDPPMAGDFQHYYFIAQSLVRGDLHHFIHYHYPPLYPLTMVPLAALSMAPETTARLAGTLAGSLTVIPLYFFGRRVFGRPAAAAGAAIYAVKYLQISVQGGAEPLMLLLTITGAALGLHALNEPTARRVATTAALFGLATLAKMEGMAFFVLWLFWLGARLIFLIPRTRAAGLAALAVACFYLPQIPYLGAFYADTGHLVINPKLATIFYIHNEPDWSQGSYALHRDQQGVYTVFQRVISEGDRRQDLDLLDYAINNSSRLAELYLARFQYLRQNILPQILRNLCPLLAGAVVLLILGVVRRRWDWRQARAELHLWSYALLPFALVPLFFPEVRFFTVTIAALTLVLGRGTEQLVRVVAAPVGGARKPRVRSITLIIAAMLMILPDLGLMAVEKPTLSTYRQTVEDRTPPAEFIREHLEPGRRIMSMWLLAPFWHLAGIEPERDLGLPIAPLDELIAYARQQNVQFIVVEMAETRNRYPDLIPLFEPDFKHPELRLVYQGRSKHGGLYVIYLVGPEQK